MTGWRRAATAVLCASLWLGPARTPRAQGLERGVVHVSGAPVALVDPDFGFGYGGIGQVSWQTWRVQLASLVSTRSLRQHRLTATTSRLGDLPLKLALATAYRGTRTQSYCGLVPHAACDSEAAEAAARIRGVGPDHYDEFVDRYYRISYVSTEVSTDLEWQLSGSARGLGLLAGWRGAGIIPGELGNQQPYPGSLYTSRFPKGEEGFVSVVQGGFAWEERRPQSRPWRGFRVEASLRDASATYGSAWSFSGANASTRFYVPLSGRELVWANRFTADVLWGDVPTTELAMVGGTDRREAFGGPASGRGARPWRGLGRLKVLAQSEVRAELGSFRALGGRRLVGAVGFVDMGWIDARPDETVVDSEAMASVGAGLRLAWFEDLVIRIDAGFSVTDEFAPRMLVGVGDVW